MAACRLVCLLLLLSVSVDTVRARVAFGQRSALIAQVGQESYDVGGVRRLLERSFDSDSDNASFGQDTEERRIVGPFPLRETDGEDYDGEGAGGHPGAHAGPGAGEGVPRGGGAQR